MTWVKNLALLGVGAAWIAAPLAQADVVPQQKGNPCDAVWEIFGATATAGGGRKPYTLTCQDGNADCDSDGSVDGKCALAVNACVGSTNVEGCTAAPLNAAPKFAGKIKKVTGFSGPTATAGPNECGTEGVLTLNLRGKSRTKPSKPALLVMKTKGASGAGLNRLKVICTPAPAVQEPECTGDGPGMPAKLVAVIRDTGSDLDNGFSGASHNFVITAQSKIRYCLSGCDGVNDPECAARAVTGPGTETGPTWGAPLPLLSTNVPVCVVNRFREQFVDGNVNVQTGQMDTVIKLFADTYVRPGKTNDVCPRCDDGRCSSGKRAGQACTANGTSTVTGSPTPSYNLSSDCLPEGRPAGSLEIDLPVTNRNPVSSAAQSKPCAAQVGQREDDRCSPGATCAAASCTTPIGEFGGLQQTCCSAPANTPCFPTRSGQAIVREGTAAPFTPAFPDTTYPQTTSVSLAATFCIPATTDPTVDNLSGLPGPGAIVAPLDITLTAAP